ncbi:polysaccharide deacetylase family protein [Mangrovivirga sp. M17]|uniref:Polysaccharide deacetylase family protein n=1 Tax=Mangrovivirga halotolerans TaxID=2993936 RepID=A0ABT3RTU4_9BACT|nr:polysaccharide deacetylase family protein [Mangrovivirga halotolerans]MCX2745199.1 polysaccharide deacetylase family protein [Mangrovivirga halotolerans]
MNFDFTLKSKILAYHQFSAKNEFTKHLKLIKNRTDVLITVDDGDLSFYENAFPLLRKYNIPSILFIIPSLIETDKPFWWDEYEYYSEKQGDKNELNWLKSIPNIERLSFLETLKQNSSKPIYKKKQLRVDQLLEMQDNGVIIANHSYSHPMFDQCTEDELREELSKTKDFFDRNNLNGFDIFAYPNGNYNDQAESILKEFGIKYAFLFDHKINGENHNPLRISRLSVNDSTPMAKFKFILSGWHSKLLPLIKAGHKLLN